VEQDLITRPVAPAREWSPRHAISLLMGYFVLFGITVGGQGVLWADMKAALRLSDGVFGTSQLVSPVLGVTFLLFGAPLVALLGKKRLALAGLLVLGLSSLALAAAGGLWPFVGALVLSGLGFGSVELVMNSATLDWEQATRRDVMNIMHAGFSGGAVVGALLAGALLQWSWVYTGVLALLAALCGLAFVATLPVRFPPAEAAPSAGQGTLAALRLLVSGPTILALAILGLLGVVGESVANTWSVIYLRSLGAEAFVGGAAYALFNGTMFAGRLVNQPLVERWGARASLLFSGTLLVISGAMLLLPGQLWLAVAAFALAGLGVAGVVPTVLSAAARLVPGSSGAVTGAIMAVCYLGFVVCAPLIGWLAELFSLQIALVSVAVSGALILLLAARAPR
jgi:MFS family permease